MINEDIRMSMDTDRIKTIVTHQFYFKARELPSGDQWGGRQSAEDVDIRKN